MELKMLSHPRKKDFMKTKEHTKWLRGHPDIPMLLLGTSVMERFEWHRDAKPAFLAAGLQGAFNAGVGGDWINDILYRLQDLKLLDSSKGNPPKLVVLEGGTNDLDVEEVNLDLVAAGTAQCMDIIRARFPETHISLLGAFPRASRAPEGSAQPTVSEAVMLGRVAGLNQRLEQLVARRAAQQPSCSCSFDGCAADFLEGGRPKQQFYEQDGMHCSPEGYRVLADLLASIKHKYAP